MLNKIYNEDALITMSREELSGKVNVVMTSPPYNTSRKNSELSFKNFNSRYDIYVDQKTDEEYVYWTIEIFNGYDKVLAENGVILYNISYSSEKPHLMWLVISEIINKTNFTIADCIIWKKKTAIPNNVSPNKLTRIVEYVLVICRKSELKTFQCNKRITSVRKSGQNNYENIFNFIEARNNDGTNNLNRATFSTELVEKLLHIYAKKDSVVYDSFMGVGTTAKACRKLGLSYVGSEISEAQVKLSLC